MSYYQPLYGGVQISDDFDLTASLNLINVSFRFFCSWNVY